ncbi:MAG TPA: carbohydrate binding domain-containing protein, partial [Roseateles sp.]|nr:carbohydrate binding domain-containing protein [Roseateles sp.]
MKKRLITWLLCLATQLAGATVLDDMQDMSRWKASASDQVKASLRRDAQDGSLCLDYDFAGVSGYAVMRRELPLDWPAEFALTAQMKGRGGANDVQLKFVDASGDNVWWINRPALALPETLTESSFKRRHIAFAWGPTPVHELRRSQFIEFVVVAGQQGGGAGSLCVGSLALEPR